MKLFQTIILTAIAGLPFVISPQSQAALVYSVVFDQSSYFAAPNELVTVNVLLRETATDGELLRLNTGGGDGLFTAGFRLDFGTSTSGSGSFLPASTNSTRVTTNPAFDDTGSRERSVTGSTLSVFVATSDGVDGVEFSAVGPSASLQLASIQFTASSVPGDVTTLTLQDLTGGANTLFLDFYSPDDASQLTFGSATINVTAVPEPSSAGLAFVALMAVTRVARRRRCHLPS